MYTATCEEYSPCRRLYHCMEKISVLILEAVCRVDFE
jgi:hypothetical protein